jgi:hypothetical protein
MIAIVMGWFAVLTALLFLLPKEVRAADDLGAAAREVARKTAAFAGRGESVAATWRNLSSLPAGDLAQARAVFESGLRDSGVRPMETGAAIEARVTLSESQSQYLLVAEVHKGEERQTFIASWKRAPSTASVPAGAIMLDRKLLLEQNEPILDVALTPALMLVLSPSKVTLYARHDGQAEERQSIAFTPARPWPRDPRARLRLTGAAFKAFLPGTLCTGAIEPALTLDCRPSDEMWTLDSGSRAVLLAAFAPGRNHFDGRIVTQSGARKTVPPFFTAGALEEQGRQYWVLALTDGRTQIFDANFDPAGSIPNWGSDLAATDARCGSGTQILATRPGDLHETDSLRAYALINRMPTPITAPVELPGPVTALWSTNGVSAVAVAHDLSTGRYAAFLFTVICGG